MKIQDVSSMREALSIKAEMNHDGDYSVQSWEHGREFLIEFPDDIVRIRWEEESSSKTKPSSNRTENNMQTEIPSRESAIEMDNKVIISGLQGSRVFAEGRRKG